MNINLFFGSPIVMIENLIEDEYNQKIITKLKEIHRKNPKSSDDWNCNIYTTHAMFDLQEDDLFRDLLKKKTELVEMFARSLTNNENKRAEVVDSWFNISEKYQYQEQHIHNNVHISTIYYAKSPEGSAQTIFKSPVEDIFSFGSTLYSDVKISPKEKSLLIFPSNLPHLTSQHLIDETRISVASNFNIGE